MAEETSDELSGVSRVVYSTRWFTGIAVLFALIGALLMLLVGAVTTLKGIGVYFGSEEAKALSSDAALTATTEMVSSLDEFLLALVLMIFAFGVYRLFVSQDQSEGPDWLTINSVTDLKIKLLETIATLLAVIFLKGALSVEAGDLQWEELVLPIAVGIFALTTYLIRRSH